MKKKNNTRAIGYVGSILKRVRFSKEERTKWTGYINSYLKENKPTLKAEANHEKRCIDIYEN